jgi:predicted outer membrane lipoprotein
MTGIEHILAAAPADGGLTPAGWLMMVGSVGVVLALCAFCVIRALRESHPEEHMHAPLDIDTHDTDE